MLQPLPGRIWIAVLLLTVVSLAYTIGRLEHALKRIDAIEANRYTSEHGESDRTLSIQRQAEVVQLLKGIDAKIDRL